MPRVATPVLKAVQVASWAELDSALAQLTGRASEVRRAMIIGRYMGLRIGQSSRVVWNDTEDDWERLGPAMRIGERLSKTEQEEAMDRWIPIPSALWKLMQRWRMLDGRPDGSQPIVGPGFPRDPHDTMNGAFKRAGVRDVYWVGHSTHVARKRLNTHLATILADIPRRYFLGRSEPTTEGKHYIDPRELFPIIRAALGTIPPLPEEVEQAALMDSVA